MTMAAQNTNWNDKLWKEAADRDGLKEIRARAWQNFQASGFPSQKSEAWRYTSTAELASSEFLFCEKPKPDTRILEHLKSHLDAFKGMARLIFWDGWFIPQISDLGPIEQHIDFSSVRDLVTHRPKVISLDPEKEDGFSAMNMALFQEGVWLNVRDGASPAVPLLIYFLQTSSHDGGTSQMRHWLTLGKNASLKILEWHDALGQSSLFWNQETAIRLAPQARLEHIRFQNAGKKTWIRAAADIQLAEKSSYRRFDLETGAQISRNEIKVLTAGAQSECLLNGVGVGCGAQHFDTQVKVDHAVPEAASRQAYRYLLGGSAQGVFGGRVLVRKDSQKTDAHQVHKTLLLSETARADIKPQLQIDADDVKCSHGAAIGQLSEDSLFYLQSRGIRRANAEKILAAGFVEHLLESISNEWMRTFLKTQLKSKLSELFVFSPDHPDPPRN